MLKVRDRPNFGVRPTSAARDALVESDEETVYSSSEAVWPRLRRIPEQLFYSNMLPVSVISILFIDYLRSFTGFCYGSGLH